MTFKERLFSMLEDTSAHHRPRSEVMEESVKDRLNASLLQYQKELEESQSYLQKRSEINVMRKINKEEQQGKQ